MEGFHGSAVKKNPARDYLGPDEDFLTVARSYWIVRVNVVEWLKLPLVPVMVKVRVPGVALRPTDTERVELPEPVMAVGLKLALTRDPWPLTLRFTVPVKPFSPLTVTVDVPVVPRVTV